MFLMHIVGNIKWEGTVQDQCVLEPWGSLLILHMDLSKTNVSRVGLGSFRVFFCFALQLVTIY